MKIACAPTSGSAVADNATHFMLYGLPHSPSLGTAGNGIAQIVNGQGMAPAPRAWDLLSIALGIVAADESCPREQSSDGWTRQLELDVAVADPDFWSTQAVALEATLGFLTGDLWRIRFSGGGTQPAGPRRPRAHPQDSVCLLSGGMDSLVGALDLAAAGRSVMLASQVSQGDKVHQGEFARLIPGATAHLQLNHNVRPPTSPVRLYERSQRARSVIFLAYGVLAATALDRYRSGGTVDLFVPENGFISLNVPLTPLRLGSLSTRTTHPVFMAAMQRILAAADLRVRLETPYRFKTKGEMLVECRNQALVRAHAFETTSCGRYARMAFTHCGRCVPCLVRRAAIRHWGMADGTPYRYEHLSRDDRDHRHFDDVRSAAMAVEHVRLHGLDRWIGAALSSAQLGEVAPYRAVVDRGLEELRAFLAGEGVL
jgi:hypothetical protein